MATHKRSRSENEDASRLSSADNDSPTTSVNNSDLPVANKRARQSALIDKILNVVELCEQVLSHLPLYDLLRAMQVCRTFKQNIETSSRLQKNLFLTPDLPRPRLVMSASGTLLSGIEAEQQIAAAEAAGERETGEFTCCTLHPDLQLDPGSHRVFGFIKKYKGMVYYAAHRFHPSEFFTTDSVVVGDSILSSTDNGIRLSGLENMLITQPPVASVDIMVPAIRRLRSCEAANKAAGVTFGDVFKTISRLAGKYWFKDRRAWWLSFDCRVFVVSDRARAAIESAGELSSEDDPTRWVLKECNEEYVLKEGGLEFV